MKARWGLGLLLLAACAGDGGDEGGPTNLIGFSSGFVERNGLAVRFLRADTSAVMVADSLITWSAAPAGLVEFLDSARVHFLDTGTVTLTAVVGTDTVHRAFHIAAPPTIVFDQTVAGNQDIYSVALDGLDSARLTTDPAADKEPSVRAGKVTFLSYRGGHADLWRVGLGGGSASAVTTNTIEEGDPAVAPGGGAIAFTELIGGIPKLYRTNGLAPVPVTGAFSDGAVDAHPSWSRDGGRIAFVSSQNGPVRLWVANLGNGSLDTLPGHGASGADVEPAWSPDGGYIAFASSRDGPTEIYILDLLTGAATRLTLAGGSNGQPAWTPDGRLVYTTFVGGSTKLRWIDPLVGPTPAPTDTTRGIHEIPGSAGAQHPAALLP